MGYNLFSPDFFSDLLRYQFSAHEPLTFEESIASSESHIFETPNTCNKCHKFEGTVPTNQQIKFVNRFVNTSRESHASSLYPHSYVIYRQ